MLGGFALCGRTLPQASFTERVELAPQHGFTHVSLMAHDARPMLDRDVPVADVRALLDTHGVTIAELDAVVGWLPGTEPLPMGCARPSMPPTSSRSPTDSDPNASTW